MVKDAMDNTVICPTWIPPLNFWGEYLFTFKITRYSLEQQFEHSDEDYEIFFSSCMCVCVCVYTRVKSITFVFTHNCLWGNNRDVIVWNLQTISSCFKFLAVT